MTDFTNDSSHMQSGQKRHRQSTTEYRVYLTLIFIAAVPFCAAIWAYSLIRHKALPARGPSQMALSEARTITPRIFWA